MFGYIYVNEQELKLREITAYRSFYCGLCRNLHKRYGRMAQMMLNYDLTFLGLLLSGLYEPDTVEEEHRCIPHPVRQHKMIQNEAMDYAADMCVLLSWQKLHDDWVDEGKQTRRAGAALLKKAYKKVALSYPRQTQSVEKNIFLLHEAERKLIADIQHTVAEKTGETVLNLETLDYMAGLNGSYLAEIFDWKEDIWQTDLKQIGFFLGKFIYLMDALEDIEKDRKNNNYNPFSQCGDVWGSELEQQIQSILMDMMTEAARAFERLPIVENVEIMRNILYAGVWCKYAALREKDTAQEKKE